MANDDELINLEELARLQNLDEQIDQRLRGRAPAQPNQDSALDTQLIRDLHAFYQPRAQAFQGSLDRVWNRLEQRGVIPRSQNQPSGGPIHRSRLQQERLHPMQRFFPSWPSRVSALIAAVLLVVLVSGLTLGLILVHRPDNGTATNPTNKATPTQASTPLPSPTPAPSPTSAPGRKITLTSIHMTNATTGWAQGPAVKAWRIWRTTDGGLHWQDVTPPSAPTAAREMATYYLNASVAWVVAQDGTAIFRTTNGGQTWQKTPLHERYLGGQLTFINQQDGWLLISQGFAAGSEGVDLLRTTDGGASWTRVSTTGAQHNTAGTIPFSGQKTGISFLNANTGWMTGTEPAPNFSWLYVTHDGGVTWQHQTLPLPPSSGEAQHVLMPPTFFNAQDGVLPDQFGAAIDVYVTHNGGATWQATPQIPTTASNIIDFIDAGHGWATNGTTLLATSDGAQHWTRLPASHVFHDVTSLDFVSSDIGWAISQPTSGSPALLETTNGGRTWSIITPTA